MKAILLSVLSFGCVLTSGCMSMPAAMPPQRLAAQPQDAAAPIIGMVVQDARGTEDAGTIGALSIEVSKSDITTYTQNAMSNALVADGFRVVPIPDPGLLGVPLHTLFAGKAVVVRVNHVNIQSIDALLDPADGRVTLSVHVYDRQGKSIYHDSYEGNASQWIGISWKQKAEGNIIAMATSKAVGRLVHSPEFQEAIN